MITIRIIDKCRAERPVLAEGEGGLDVIGDRDDHLAAENLGLSQRAGGEHEA